MPGPVVPPAELSPSTSASSDCECCEYDMEERRAEERFSLPWLCVWLCPLALRLLRPSEPDE